MADPTPAERLAVDRAMAALDEMAREWSGRVDLTAAVCAMAAQDDRESRLEAYIQAAYVEGLYEGRLSHAPDDLERATLRAEVARLTAMLEERWKEAAQLHLREAGPREGGRFGFEVQSSILPALGEHLAEMFKASGGTNYVGFSMEHAELGGLMITIQRNDGKTPEQVGSEQRKRAERAEKALEDVDAAAASLAMGLPQGQTKMIRALATVQAVLAARA